MKSILCTGLFVLAIGFAQAQEEKGAAQVEQLCARMKSELNLTDVQVDSVKAIQQDFRTSVKTIFSNKQLSKEEQKQQIVPFRMERDRRLKAVLSREQAAKVREMIRIEKNENHPERPEHPRKK